MPVEQKRNMIDESDAASIARQCNLVDLKRSTYYYKPQPVNDKDLKIMAEMDKLHMEDPTRGTRRMMDELFKLDLKVGRQHVRKLMQIMRMKTIYCRPRTTVITPGDYKFPYLLRNLKINHVNQVWAIDITYVPMKKGYMYLFVIIDLYSRYIVGWSVSNTMETSWITQTLMKAISQYGIPEIINSDQGSQFTSEDYVSYIKSLKTCEISMDAKGVPLTMSMWNASFEPSNTRNSTLFNWTPDTMWSRLAMSLSIIIIVEEIIHPYKKEPRKMFTNQLHRQTLSSSMESKLFPKFILETSKEGSPENFRITLTAYPGVDNTINLNLSKNCTVKLDQLSTNV